MCIEPTGLCCSAPGSKAKTYAWTGSERFRVGSVLMDFPLFWWAPRKS